MPTWFTAIGVGCIGMVCGYLLFYSYKRLNPPLSEKPLPVGEVLTLLVAIGAGGMIGGVFVALEGVNYIGAYGMGLFVGTATNVWMTRQAELRSKT